MIYSDEWCNTGVSPLIDIYLWWIEQLNKNDIIHVEDINLMPTEARVEQEDLLSQGVQSITSVPLSVDRKIEAYIRIDSVKSVKVWTDEDIKLIHIIADILSKRITQIKHINKINFILHHDTLTGLPNRLLLTNKLECGIQKASRKKQSLSILFVNLDGFKRINDTLGYHQENDLLKQVSERLLSICSGGASVYRPDGDQFILYLRNYQDEAELDFIVAQVINTFSKSFVLRVKNM